MRRLLPIFILVLISINTSLFAQSEELTLGLNAINEKAIQGQLEFLASDWMEGRDTGERGIYLAGDYVVSLFKVYGLEPAGDVETIYPSRAERRAGKQPQKIGTYFQNFSMIKYHAAEDQEFSISSTGKNAVTTHNFNYKTDFYVNVSNVGIELDAPVVFVGYGFKNEDEGYNDFEDIDVKGKVIMRLAGFPGHKDTSSAAYKKFKPEGRYAMYYMRRNKNNVAEEAGAVAVIDVNLDEDVALQWATNYPLRYNSDYYEGDESLRPYRTRVTLPGETLSDGMNSIDVTARVGNALVAGTDVDFEKFEKNAKEKMKPDSKVLKGKSVHLETNVESEIIRTRNVVGKIEGENPDEVIVIGAHYDHVGNIKGYIYNGADDNGSGSVGVMTMAKAIMATGVKPKKTIIFALWTGEEKGLLGSRYFVDKYDPIENIKTYLNFDMISRNNYGDSLGTYVNLSYSNAVPFFKESADLYNEEFGFGLDIEARGSDRPRGGSDHSSFSAKDVPVFYYFTGFHDDYHQIGDHADKANYEKMTKVVQLSFLQIFELANMDGMPLKKEE